MTVWSQFGIKQATPGTNVHSWYNIIYLHWYISYQKYSRYTSVITVSLNTTYLSHLQIYFDKKQQTWISILRLVHACSHLHCAPHSRGMVANDATSTTEMRVKAAYIVTYIYIIRMAPVKLGCYTTCFIHASEFAVQFFAAAVAES